MKKLLKSVICRTREQCTGALFTIDLSTIMGWTKKQKKKERRSWKRRRAIQTAPIFKWDTKMIENLFESIFQKIGR